MAIAALLVSSAAAAAPDAVFARAMQDFNEGRTQRAAAGFREAGADLHLAQSLERLGLPFSAFFHYAGIVQAGPAHPDFLKAVEGAALTARQVHDDVIAPNLFAKAGAAQLASIAPAARARIDASLALLAFRAGRLDDAARLAAEVPPGADSFAEAQYIAGLAQQRAEPDKALQTFRAVGASDGAERELRELAALAVGRTLYGLHRYAEASAAYAKVPRFSRHWDEALFEGAWADLQNGDPGAALGRLHSLHAPHLRDEFVPESLNLAAVLFHQRCLYAQAREAISRFDAEYLPMRAQVKELLQASVAPAELWTFVTRADTRLPAPVQRHLQKNERVASFRSALAFLARESARIRADAAFAATPLGRELLEDLDAQEEQTRQLGGKFVQGRLSDMARLIDVLESETELIAFETTKGEKEMLETRTDPTARLASQRLERPAMPGQGHEYWPFDGEYWPDEIGYYRYTIKDACPARSREE